MPDQQLPALAALLTITLSKMLALHAYNTFLSALHAIQSIILVLLASAATIEKTVEPLARLAVT